MFHLQTLVNGIVLGALYTCLAVGFSLVWGVLNVINMLHGSLIVLGGYVTFFAWHSYGIHPLVALPFVAIALYGVGYVTQFLMINRVVDEPVNALHSLHLPERSRRQGFERSGSGRGRGEKARQVMTPQIEIGMRIQKLTHRVRALDDLGASLEPKGHRRSRKATRSRCFDSGGVSIEALLLALAAMATTAAAGEHAVVFVDPERRAFGEDPPE